MCTNLQFTADLFTFTKEMLNRKLNFLWSVTTKHCQMLWSFEFGNLNTITPGVHYMSFILKQTCSFQLHFFFQVWMTFYWTPGAEGLSKETDIIAEV